MLLLLHCRPHSGNMLDTMSFHRFHILMCTLHKVNKTRSFYQHLHYRATIQHHCILPYCPIQWFQMNSDNMHRMKSNPQFPILWYTSYLYLCSSCMYSFKHPAKHGCMLLKRHHIYPSYSQSQNCLDNLCSNSIPIQDY